jgi:hypothetical protein
MIREYNERNKWLWYITILKEWINL